MAWRDVASAQSGVITRAQLRECGLNTRAIERLVSSGAIRSCERAVYLVGGAPPTYSARLWSTVLVTKGVLGFATGAHLWGLVERPDSIDVIIEPTRRLQPRSGVRFHYVEVPSSQLTTVRGLVITSRRWALLDYLSQLPAARAQQLIDRALQRGWLTRHDIARRITEHPQRAGNAQLRGILDATADGAAAASERILQRLLRRAGLTGWTANYRVWVDGHLIAEIDIAFVRLKLAIEVDGWAYHSDVLRFQRDRERSNQLVNLGWTILHFTWADLAHDPGGVIVTIRQQCAQVM